MNRFRDKIGAAERAAVIYRDGRVCQYCGRTVQERSGKCHVTHKDDLTIDHIIPESRGGSSTRENLIVSCFECNNYKGSRQLKEEFLNELFERIRSRSEEVFA